eukprot:GEMP01050349.1.p1 GENE.GEMP01050349.1~~GEMP01050349.1.p1  ORF type:complete len:185 (-),score=52.11 GEMP01050349.1:918-1472(-)
MSESKPKASDGGGGVRKSVFTGGKKSEIVYRSTGDDDHPDKHFAMRRGNRFIRAFRPRGPSPFDLAMRQKRRECDEYKEEYLKLQREGGVEEPKIKVARKDGPVDKIKDTRIPFVIKSKTATKAAAPTDNANGDTAIAGPTENDAEDAEVVEANKAVDAPSASGVQNMLGGYASSSESDSASES